MTIGKRRSSAGRRLGRVAVALVVLGVLGAGGLLLAALRVKLAGEEATPSGLRRNVSHYVAMRDGTRLAVDLWLPADYRAGERLPALMRTTRYGRARQPGLELRLRVLLGLARADALVGDEVRYFSERHFVLVLADMRGSGASEGELDGEFSAEGIWDLGDLAGWAAAQPWSNGRVGSYGVSYDGDTAEMAAVAGNPALQAEAPLFDDFDTMLGLARPGGVYDRVIDGWSQWVYAADRAGNRDAGLGARWRCWLHGMLGGGVKHTDEDGDGRLLAAIEARRNNPPLVASLRTPEFRDDTFASAKGPVTLGTTQPYGMRRQIEARHVPMMVWCGWMDAATADGALSRWKNFTNPQVVVLGAYTHGGGHGTDPLLRNFDAPNPPEQEQWRMEADFFDGILRGEPAAKIDAHIDYYTMGEGVWHSTSVWPVVGLKTRRLYFAGHNGLEGAAPKDGSASDGYRVDASATTGLHSRWLTQLNEGYVDYGNRAGADEKLLTYTSEPLKKDTEITGTPVLRLELESTAADGAVHAYLEDVAADGRVTYLTEGILRLMDRKTTEAPLPYEPLGPRHSYLRGDAEAMRPGRLERVEMGMFATSVLLRKGDRGFAWRWPARTAIILS